MLDASRKPSFVAASYPHHCNRYVAYGFKEELWTLDFDADSIVEGRHVKPYLRMDFNLDRLDQRQEEGLPDAVRRFAEASAATGLLCSGFGDAADVSETACGVHYSGSGVGWVRFQRQLRRLLWVRAGEDRHHKARGVFWANLFGPAMLKKMGGAEKFVREYKALEDRRDHELSTIYPDGSVLVLLSSHVKDMRYPYVALLPSTLERAAWLYERLSHAGLMCGS